VSMALLSLRNSMPPSSPSVIAAQAPTTWFGLDTDRPPSGTEVSAPLGAASAGAGAPRPQAERRQAASRIVAIRRIGVLRWDGGMVPEPSPVRAANPRAAGAGPGGTGRVHP